MGNRTSIFCFGITIAMAGTGVQASDGWYDTYEEAQEAADERGVPLLIHFHASYCGPCRQMNAKVFSHLDVQQKLRQGIAAVEVDVSIRPDVAAKFGASTVPRDVVVYDGHPPETLGIGFKSKQAYLGMLRNVSAKGARQKSAIAEVRPVQDAGQETIRGLEGFCPVKLIRDREWIKGQKEITETYRGVTYRFSSEEMREEFRKDARRYTPQNLGCDAVVLYDDQRAVTGKIKYGAFFDDELFLFESPDNRREFKENPLKYARIRHAVRADQLTGQRFH